MPTRQKRPSLFNALALSSVLVALLTYLGINAVAGRFGIENQRVMQAALIDLRVEDQQLDTEIERYQRRIALFDPARLDPDILTERARSLLGRADPAAIIVPLPASNL
jgi:cell division protein FtsB